MSTLPKGPTSFFSQVYETYFGNPHAVYLKSARAFGDIFTTPTLFGPHVVVGHPDGIKTIFSAEPGTFLVAVGKLLEIFPNKAEGSLFLLEGEQHRAARKLLAPSFHGARMRTYGALMRDIALQKARSWVPGQPFRMLDATQDIALDIIIQAIFGVVGSERIARFHKQIVDSFDAFVPAIVILKGIRRNFMGIGPWARFKRRFAELERMAMEEVAAHRQSPEGREDILALLLQSRYDDGTGLSDIAIFSQLLTFLFAGHETSAITLAWAFYLLHHHPETLARLHEELAPHASSLDPEAIAKLPYLEAVCNETLRLRSPISPIVRRILARPLTILGHELPAGTHVAFSPLLVHMRPDLYPEPEKFRPERFLSRTYSPHEFLPFGGGVRRCIGAAFAMYELKIVLASVLATHQLKLLETQPVEPRMRAATVAPKGGIRMALERARMLT